MLSANTYNTGQKIAKSAIFFAGLLPFIVLLIAIFGIGVTVGTFNFIHLPVHEDGVRTFAKSVFYFEHAAREMPLDILLALVIGGSAAFGLHTNKKYSGRFYWVAAFAIILFILIGATVSSGSQELLENLFQNHTRPGEASLLGSHWYYHFLSRSVLLIIAISFGFLLRGVSGKTEKSGLSLVLIAMSIFAAISIGFSFQKTIFQAAFSDPIYLGHQARELFTHALVTVPLAFFSCALVSSEFASQKIRKNPLIAGFVLIIFASSIAAYIGTMASSGNAISMGQSGDIRVLLFPHFFEHSLGYLMVPIISTATFLTVGATSKN